METINKVFNENYEMIDNIATNISEKYKVDKDEVLSYGFESLYDYISDKDEKEITHSGLYMKLYRDMTRCVPDILGFGDNKTLFWEYTKESARLMNEYSQKGIEATIDIDFVTKVVDMIAENSDRNITSSTKKEWTNMILLCNSVSLNEISEASDLAYLEKLSETIEGEYLSEELKTALLDNMYSLRERDKKILIERYGLDDEGLKTLKEVGDKHYIVWERVRAIETKSLAKMRKKKIKTKLKAYTDYDFRINGSNSNSEVGRIIT